MAKEANECFAYSIHNQQMLPNNGSLSSIHVEAVRAETVSAAFQFHSMIFAHIA